MFGTHMSRQGRTTFESTEADCTSERLFARVRSHMRGQVPLLRSPVKAILAAKRLLPCVCPDVNLEGGRCGEHLGADVAWHGHPPAPVGGHLATGEVGSIGRSAHHEKV